MSKWEDLVKKPLQQRTDGDRVAIAAVIELSVGPRSHCTMDEIFEELLGSYNNLMGHCDPVDKRGSI